MLRVAAYTARLITELGLQYADVICDRVAPKSKPPPIFQKIVLKIANEIRFLRKVKV